VDGELSFSPVAAFQKSSFGTFYDKYCSNTQTGCSPGRQSGSCDAFASAYNAAVAAYPNDKHATIDLDADHKEALAEGKTITVSEYELPAAALCTTTVDEYWTRTCSGTTYYTDSGAVDNSRSTDSCGKPENNGTGPSNPGSWHRANDPAHPDRPYNTQVIQAAVTQQGTSVWQAITAHCNSTDFNAVTAGDQTLKDGDFGGILDSGDSTRYYSASAVSKVYSATALANGTAKLPWGASSSNASAQASFYSRICSFDGTLADPSTNKTVSGDGSSAGFWTFFRTGLWNDLAGTNDALNYYVPDTNAMGESRLESDGYQKDTQTQTGRESWTLSYQAYQQTGSHQVSTTTQVTDYSRPYYSGTYTDKLALCDTGVGDIGAPWSSTDNWASGGPWTGGLGGNANKGAILNGLQWLKCNVDYGPGPKAKGDGSGNWYKERDYKLTSTTYPWTKSQTTTTTVPDYGWVAATPATYYDGTSANAALASCSANTGSRRNCSLTHTAATWTTSSAHVDDCTAGSSGTANTVGYKVWTCTPLSKQGAKNSVVKYAGEAPVATYLTRDPDGTPQNDEFNLRVVSADGSTSSEVFNDSTASAPTQQQFIHTPFSSSTVGIVYGSYTKVQARGIWASDGNRPQVFTLRYRFEPYMTNNAPVSNIGFGKAGGGASYASGSVQARIAGMVSAIHGSSTSTSTSAMKQAQWSNSGQATTDKLDVPLYAGTKGQKDASTKQWKTKPSLVDPSYWGVELVRATTE